MTGQMKWEQVLAQLAQGLRRCGLDLTAPLSVDWYNAIVASELHLPWLGRQKAPLAILVGNSKAIWKPFQFALRARPSLLEEKHPLDAYVRQSVNSSLKEFSIISTPSTLISASPAQLRENGDSKLKAAVYWDHDTSPGKLVAMQRLACISGGAYFDEDSHLCIHPKFGSWFALRAVVLFDVDPPTEQPEILQNPCTAEDRERIREAIKRARDQSYNLGQEGSWRKWLAVRDAIQPHHPMRYSVDQIEYHYTHNKDILVKQVNSQPSPTISDPFPSNIPG